MEPIKWGPSRHPPIPNEILYDILGIILLSDWDPYDIRDAFVNCARTCRGLNYIAAQFLYERFNIKHYQLEAPLSFYASKYFAIYDYDRMVTLDDHTSNAYVDADDDQPSSTSSSAINRVKQRLPLVKYTYDHPIMKLTMQIDQRMSSLRAIRYSPLANPALLVFSITEYTHEYALLDCTNSQLYDVTPLFPPRYELYRQPEYRSISSELYPQFYRQRPFQFVKSLGIHLSELIDVSDLSDTTFPNLRDLWLTVDRVNISARKWGLPRRLAELKLSFSALSKNDRHRLLSQHWDWVDAMAPNLQSLVLHDVRGEELNAMNNMVAKLALKSFALIGNDDSRLRFGHVESYLAALTGRSRDTLRSLYLKNCDLLGISEHVLEPFSNNLSKVFLYGVNGGTQLLAGYGRLQVFEASHWEDGNLEAVMKANVNTLKSLCICQDDGQSILLTDLMESAVTKPIVSKEGHLRVPPKSNLTSLAITTKQAHKGRCIEWLKKYGSNNLQQLYIYDSMTTMQPSYVSNVLNTVVSTCHNLQYLHLRDIQNSYLNNCICQVISTMRNMKTVHYEKNFGDGGSLDGDQLLKAVAIRKRDILGVENGNGYIRNGMRGSKSRVLSIIGQGTIAFNRPYYPETGRFNPMSDKSSCCSAGTSGLDPYQNGQPSPYSPPSSPSMSTGSLTHWAMQQSQGIISFHGISFVLKS